MSFAHIPVLGKEAITALKPYAQGVYVDATFGRGGYTILLLESGAGRVIAIDRDPDALQAAAEIQEKYGARFHMITGCFGDLAQLLLAANINHVDGIVFDIGVSSPQLDDPNRGFSFRHDGPLDMRMSANGRSAADIINTASEEEIANILYEYGEERASRRIARAIVTARIQAPITRTTHLASIIASVLPKHGDTHPATKSFQALRIVVNDELGELERGLSDARQVLSPDGYMAVVTFHSLEDRIVKNFFRVAAGRVSTGSRHRPAIIAASVPTMRLITNKAVTASAEECRINPRSRSAKLRVAQKNAIDRVEASHA